jgi:hypothetical protein
MTVLVVFSGAIIILHKVAHQQLLGKKMGVLSSQNGYILHRH